MAVWFITGKLGSGKSLVAVSKAQEYIARGCVVATNVDLNLSKMCKRFNKTATVYRVPDKPELRDLEQIGKGNTGYDEQKNGLLLLDECGTWFNSRNWNDKSRKDVVDWFLHARKLGWDIIFLVQDISIIDKQARMTLCEYHGVCTRLDRFKVPIVNMLVSPFIGRPVTFPKIHTCKVRLGQVNNGVVIDRWTYRAKHVYAMYDTKQCFSDSYPHSTYQVLPPYYVNRNGKTNWSIKNIMRLTKIHLRSWGRPALLASVFGLALVGSWYGSYINEPAPVSESAAGIEEPAPVSESAAGIEEPESSFSISGLVRNEKGDDNEPNTISSEYEGFEMVGYISTRNSYFYQLRKGKELKRIASNQRFIDRIVKADGLCGVSITAVDNPRDTVTITDPNCFNTYRMADNTAIDRLEFQPYCNDYGCIDLELDHQGNAQRGLDDPILRPISKNDF